MFSFSWDEENPEVFAADFKVETSIDREIPGLCRSSDSVPFDDQTFTGVPQKKV